MEIIAEIGQNHNGDLGLARELIRAAREAGAQVAKFQVYDAQALFPKEGNPWFDYNCRTELSRRALEILQQECNDAGIEFMSSVFDVERVGWLEALGVKRYKIASRSIHDQPLLEALVKTGKPLIASLGMWEGKGFPLIPGARHVDYLYCLSKYPTPPEDLHLADVDFGRWAGFSDHTLGIVAAQVACARGAAILEKHFTLDKTAHGPDHAGSMTPDELCALVRFRDEVNRCL